MEKKCIYVLLKGRIGNQLFIYAYARYWQMQLGDETKIIINDYEVTRQKWVNQLYSYNLPNVEYEHGRPFFHNKKFRKKIIMRDLFILFIPRRNYVKRFRIEEKYQNVLSERGLIICWNGYREYSGMEKKQDILLDGYFQSEKFFYGIRDDLLKTLAIDGEKINQHYPELFDVSNRNTVCISIKIEHNVGSSIYAVCGKKYWEDAISFVMQMVDNPLFMICSDDVDYVKNNLIDTKKYNCIYQDSEASANVTLAAMSMCQNFIIGNTTFAWWAQYFCRFEKKMVVAPSKWMLVDMPIDIYQNNWHLIEV